MAASFSFMRNCVCTWTIAFVCGRSASFVGGHPCTGTVVFIRGHSSLYMHGRLPTCTVGFEQTQVSGVMGMDVLWSLRTVVVVVWSLWMHRGWGVASMVGFVMVVARMVGFVVVVVVVATVVVVGHVVIPVHHCYWWAMGGHCQLCEGRMGTELTI